MKKLIVATLILVLVGCEKQAVGRVKTNNPSVTVELLFEVEGCKVFRFYDYRDRYFANCSGSVEYRQSKHDSELIPTSKAE